MRGRGIHVRRRTLAALIALALANPAASQSSEQTLLGTRDDDAAELRIRIFNDPKGGTWMRADDLRRLGVAVPAIGMRWHNGGAWVPANEIAGLVRIDPVAERVHFYTARVAVPATRPPTPAHLSPPPWPPAGHPRSATASARASSVPQTRPPTPAHLSPPPWPPASTPALPAAARIDLPSVPATRPRTPSWLQPAHRSPIRQPEPAASASPLSAADRSDAPAAREREAAPIAAPSPASQPTMVAVPSILPPGGTPPPSGRLPSGLPSPVPPPRPPERPTAQAVVSRPAEGDVERIAGAQAVDGPLPEPPLVTPAPVPHGVAKPPAAAQVPASVPVAPKASAPGAAVVKLEGVPTSPVIAQALEEWFLAIHNHVDAGLSILLVTDSSSRQWVRTRDLRLLGIRLPDARPALHAGETYVPLDTLPLRADLDRASDRLHLLDGPASAPAESTLIADVVVNRQALPEPQVLEWRDGELWLPPEVLESAGLVPPAGAAAADGWVPVSVLAGNHYVLDRDNLLLDLTAPPERFATRHLDGRHHAQRSLDPPPVAPGAPALLLGYDVAAGRSSDGNTWASVLADVGMSFGRTACRSRHLWRDDQRFTRLDSVCTTDWPERRLSLVLGDSASRDWGQGGAVSYGGIRLGTDFGLQPYLLTQPLLGLAGTARLPSVLEVWTEQQLAMRTEIGPGTFVIDGLPTLTGRGDITAVVTDPLGRQTRITSPFYSDPSLMATGLQDWALEAGRLRSGAGIAEDDHYGDVFGQAGLRRGMTDWWTTAVHGAATDDLRIGGWSNHLRLGLLGVVELGITGNRAGGVEGRSWTAGYSYRGQRWGFGVRQTRRDRHYADLAWPDPGTASRRELQAQMNVPLGPGSGSLGAIRRSEADGTERSFARLAVGLPLLRGHLSLSGLRAFEPDNQTTWTATWTLPLDWGNYAVWADGDRRSVRPGIAVQRNQPVGPGYGYRLAAQDNGDGGLRTNGDLRWRTNTLEGSVSAYDDDQGSRVDARVGGTLVWAGGGMHAAGARDGSYAMVKLPAPGVRIYRDHQVVATTGADGTAIVTRLRPFEVNRLAVEADDLPLDTQIQVASVDVVPGRRQVIRANFGTNALRAMTLRVSDTEGGVPTPGSLAVLLPDETPVQIGHDGLLYLEYAAPPQAIRIHWDDGAQCMIAGTNLPERQVPGDVADVRCQRVSP